MLPILVPVAVFLGVLTLIALLWAVRSSLEEAGRLELARRLGPGDLAPEQLWTRKPDLFAQWLGPLGLWLHTLRVRAGKPGSAASVLLPSLLWAVAGVLGMLLVIRGPGALVGALLGAAPILALEWQIRRRSESITLQLPDALDLTARAMRAGHAFSDALRIAAGEVPSPLGEELGMISEQHRLGLELRTCMESLLARVPDNFELSLWVGAVMLNRETGGNLIETLEHLAETVRERLVFESKVLALTAEVRTSAVILSMLPFGAAILISLAEPRYLLPLLEPGLGRSLLVGALVSMAIGAYLMRRLSRVEL